MQQSEEEQNKTAQRMLETMPIELRTPGMANVINALVRLDSDMGVVFCATLTLATLTTTHDNMKGPEDSIYRGAIDITYDVINQLKLQFTAAALENRRREQAKTDK